MQNNEEWNVDCIKASEYLDICLDAGLYDDKFNVFKSNHKYRAILEHVGVPISKVMLSDMGLDTVGSSPLNDFILSKIDKMRDSNKYGNPELYDYPLIGVLSPNTIRYIKNSWDILTNIGFDKFSSKDYKTIVEIGGGYGGMCTVIDSLIGFEKYYIFDLKEVNSLQSKYLSMTKLSGDVFPITTNECPNFRDGEIDLVISTHALSEVPYNIQMEYIDKVLSKCKSFYMDWNSISENSELANDFEKGMSHTKFIEIMSQFDVKVYPSVRNCPEDPIDSPGISKILYGTRK